MRSIDDAVARRVNRDAGTSTAWSDDPADNFYDLTDVMFSVRAVTDSTGLLHTRLEDTPYGVAMHGPAADVNGDGVVTVSDLGVVSANHNSGDELKPGDTGYDPDAFLDGGDEIDVSVFLTRYSPYVSGGSNPTFNAGWIDNPEDPNGPDNSVGYDGYWFDLAGATESTSTGLYMVRFRVYDPKLGRWLQRDPLEFVDGSNIYLAFQSSPTVYTDLMGTTSCHNVNQNLSWRLDGKARKIAQSVRLNEALLDFGFKASICESRCCDRKDVELGVFGEFLLEGGKQNFSIPRVGYIQWGFFVYGGAQFSGSLKLDGCGNSSGQICFAFSAGGGLHISANIRRKNLFEVGGRGQVGVSGQLCLSCDGSGDGYECRFLVKACVDASVRIWFKYRPESWFGVSWNYSLEGQWCTRQREIYSFRL